MRVAAFVAVVRSNISGKETRESLPCGLAVRAVREQFQVSGRRMATDASVSQILLANAGEPPRQTISCTMWEKGVIAHLPLSSLAVL
ncbi:hypothetical protein ABIE33_003463 [Ensifer sp. 4252]